MKQEEIEDRLLKRIVQKEFKIVSEIQLFSKILNNKNNAKIKLKFLEDEKYMFVELIKDTGGNEEQDLEYLSTSLKNVSKIISKIREREYSLKDEHIELLKTFKKQVEELIWFEE